MEQESASSGQKVALAGQTMISFSAFSSPEGQTVFNSLHSALTQKAVFFRASDPEALASEAITNVFKKYPEGAPYGFF